MKIPSKTLILAAGPALFFLLRSFDAPAGMEESAWAVVAVTLWMALWWVTEIEVRLSVPGRIFTCYSH